MNKSYKPIPPASHDRKSIDEVNQQFIIFSQNKLLIKLVDSLSQMLVVLNKERQIIYANKFYYEFCCIPETESLLGKRPGEAINCIHSILTAQGCGSSIFCKTCGANNAILESHNGIQSTKECRILTQTLESKDILVTSTPYDFNGESFTIFALSDISDKKRKETMERLFFHDILNSAGGISGLSSVLKEVEDPGEITEIAGIISHAADNMIEEIQVQRMLNEAERGELKLEIKEIDSLTILNDIKDLYARHQLIGDKSIEIDNQSVNLVIHTDTALLRRVIGNMVKNAIEVYNPNALITLRCRAIDQSVQFSVHNIVFIEENVQLQLFKRSFTTKGIGRGLGTYSMKLLGEKYLKGKVGFESSKQNGTTFFIEIQATHPIEF